MIKTKVAYFDVKDIYHPVSVKIKEDDISAETEHDLFIKFYKMNNRLRYCNGSYYKWVDEKLSIKYNRWIHSPEYEAISFQLFYGNGVVD